jgi:hypothetical protein
VVFAESGTRSGLYRRPITPVHEDHAPGTPILRRGGTLLFRFLAQQTFPERTRKLSSGPSRKASLGLGSLTHSRRFAQVCPDPPGDHTKRSDIMNTNTIQQKLSINAIHNGNCIEVMREMPAQSVDFILSDPPYLVNYRDRTGRSIQNDADASWLKPAMKEAYRVLKQNRLMLCFYGWNRIDKFFDAWKDAGFQPVGHIVFRKSYSSKSRFLNYRGRVGARIP